MDVNKYEVMVTPLDQRMWQRKSTSAVYSPSLSSHFLLLILDNANLGSAGENFVANLATHPELCLKGQNSLFICLIIHLFLCSFMFLDHT